MAKPFYCHTNLGIVMVKRGTSVQNVSFATQIPTRTLGFYLKGDKQLQPDHLRIISQHLDIDPRVLFQPLLMLRDLTPHQDHHSARCADMDLTPFPA